MKKILTVAGFRLFGRSGNSSDLKAITLLGGVWLSVVTALTAQNTQGVFGIHPVPLDFIFRVGNAVVLDISWMQLRQECSGRKSYKAHFPKNKNIFLHNQSIDPYAQNRGLLFLPRKATWLFIK